jgi:hypothetical protein
VKLDSDYSGSAPWSNFCALSSLRGFLLCFRGFGTYNSLFGVRSCDVTLSSQPVLRATSIPTHSNLAAQIGASRLGGMGRYGDAHMVAPINSSRCVDGHCLGLALTMIYVSLFSVILLPSAAVIA